MNAHLAYMAATYLGISLRKAESASDPLLSRISPNMESNPSSETVPSEMQTFEISWLSTLPKDAMRRSTEHSSRVTEM